MSQTRLALGMFVAALALTGAAWGEPGDPPPPAGPEDAVSKLLALHFMFSGTLPGVKGPNWQELFLPGGDMNAVYQYQRFLQGYAFFVTETPAAAQVAGDTARVQVQADPLELVLKRQGGKWLLDMDATVAGLPPALRSTVQAQMCASALQRLGAAARSYAEKHEGRLPPTETWREELTPLIGGPDAMKSVRCPEAPAGVTGFAMNEALGGRVLKEVARPENTVLFYESNEEGPNPAGGLGSVAAPRHDGLGLYVLANFQLRGSTVPLSFDAKEKTLPPVSAAGPPPPAGG
jgi:hypothetical protein